MIIKRTGGLMTKLKYYGNLIILIETHEIMISPDEEVIKGYV